MPTEHPPVWNVDRIVAETFIAEVEVHESLPSTNDYALRIAPTVRSGMPRLILANRQTSGRGRGQNSWWAAAGALTFSLLLELDADRLPAARWPEISLTVGSSVCAALTNRLPSEQFALKWPNDVFVRGAKVCGVLVEIPPQCRGRVVIGIGINVGNTVSRAPAELRRTAIALCDVGKSVSLEATLIGVLREFASQLTSLTDTPEVVRNLWRRYDLLIGRRVTLDDGITELSGTSVGIDDDGALLLRTEAGTRRCYAGVVRSFD